MKMAKKTISIVLVLMLIVNIFATTALAAGTESAVDLYISTDKTTYAPGDEVVITVSEQVIDAVGDMWIAGQYSIGYDSKVFEPYSTSLTLEDHGFTALQGGYDSSMSTIAFSDVNIENGDYIADNQAVYGWDSMIMYCVAGDMATAFSATNKADLFTIKMKIKEDAAFGTYTLGFNQGSYEIYSAFSADATMGGIYGYTDDYGYGTAVNYGLGTCEITVGAAEEPFPSTSIVTPMKGQIRFDKNADGSYAGTFDVRAIAKITGEDFNKTFGSIENAIASIESVGFVFAQGTQSTGNYDDMVAVAKAGESGNDYTYAPVDFISTSFDPGNYTFSCIVDGVDDTYKNDSLYALAYIKYVDADGATQWAFYTDVQTVSFADLYGRNFNSVFGA